ncbi:MAG: RcnB family protein [Sphingomonas sp.]|uniref:RcnB family protein n=1 Tax=Sphingomonas sp. TaxID=28214 RepID=UPI0025F593C5|nr:RcnB family protein [Sphingomonas sp.]MBX9881811.1 RcnB family protein [Sphingomonas sp.]
MRKRIVALMLGLALPSAALAQGIEDIQMSDSDGARRGLPRTEVPRGTFEGGGRPSFQPRFDAPRPQPVAPQPPVAFQQAPRAPEPAERGPAFRPNPGEGGGFNGGGFNRGGGWRDRGAGGGGFAGATPPTPPAGGGGFAPSTPPSLGQRDFGQRWRDRGGFTPPVTRPGAGQSTPPANFGQRDGWRGDRGPDGNAGRPQWNGNRPDWNRPDWNRNPRPDWNGNNGRPDWNRDRGDWNRNRDWNNRDFNNRDWNNRDFNNRGRGQGFGQFDNNRRFYDRGFGNGYDRGFNNGYRDWNRDWRRDNRYDWRGWRSDNRFIFRQPPYRAPYGWGYGYRRFSVGITLQPFFFDQQYWIGDPYYYHLPPAYYPYQWVRYYNDALLVDVDTGEVIDVIYDIFW